MPKSMQKYQSLAESLGVIDPIPSTIPEEQQPDITELTGEEFCRAVVESRQYRESIVRRILLDDLAPAVECRLMDHAWGTPPKRVELTGKNGAPIEVTRVERVVIDPTETEAIYTTH